MKAGAEVKQPTAAPGWSTTAPAGSALAPPGGSRKRCCPNRNLCTAFSCACRSPALPLLPPELLLLLPLLPPMPCAASMAAASDASLDSRWR